MNDPCADPESGRGVPALRELEPARQPHHDRSGRDRRHAPRAAHAGAPVHRCRQSRPGPVSRSRSTRHRARAESPSRIRLGSASMHRSRARATRRTHGDRALPRSLPGLLARRPVAAGRTRPLPRLSPRARPLDVTCGGLLQHRVTDVGQPLNRGSLLTRWSIAAPRLRARPATRNGLPRCSAAHDRRPIARSLQTTERYMSDAHEKHELAGDADAGTAVRHGGPTVTRRAFLQTAAVVAGAVGTPVAGAQTVATSASPSPSTAARAGVVERQRPDADDAARATRHAARRAARVRRSDRDEEGLRSGVNAARAR